MRYLIYFSMLLFSPAFCSLKSWMLWQTNLPFSPNLFFFSLSSLQPFDIFINFVSLLISQSSLRPWLVPDSKPKTSYYLEVIACRISAQRSVVAFSLLSWVLAPQILVASVTSDASNQKAVICFFLYISADFSICSNQNNWSGASYFILARSKGLTYDFENITQHVFACLLVSYLKKILASCLSIPTL